MFYNYTVIIAKLWIPNDISDALTLIHFDKMLCSLPYFLGVNREDPGGTMQMCKITKTFTSHIFMISAIT